MDKWNARYLVIDRARSTISLADAAANGGTNGNFPSIFRAVGKSVHATAHASSSVLLGTNHGLETTRDFHRCMRVAVHILSACAWACARVFLNRFSTLTFLLGGNITWFHRHVVRGRSIRSAEFPPRFHKVTHFITPLPPRA